MRRRINLGKVLHYFSSFFRYFFLKEKTMSVRNPLLVAVALSVLVAPAAFAKNPNRPTNQTILNKAVVEAPVVAPVEAPAPAAKPVKKVKKAKKAAKAKSASK